MEADPGLQTFNLPVGGKSKVQGGQGIFYDEEKDESVVVWIDIDIKDRVSIIRQLEVCLVSIPRPQSLLDVFITDPDTMIPHDTRDTADDRPKARG